MQLFTVHMRRHGLDPDRDLVLVKEGFSWPAFFVPLLFALWYRLWLMALLVAGSGLIFAGLDLLLALDPITAVAVVAGVSVVIGFIANDLRRGRLGRRGFAFAGIVAGSDREQALLRFLDSAPALAQEMAGGVRSLPAATATI